MRLNYYLAKAGVGSRREAERLMAEGHVRVNGKEVPPGGMDVAEGDKVTVNGKPVAPATAPLPRVFLYHKPAGPIVTAKDPQGRPTIWDLLPKTLADKKPLPRLVSVGRLDANSEGLLLLTNDGALAQRLMSPDTALEREYRVRVFGALGEAMLERIRAGVRVQGVQYRGADIYAERAEQKAVKVKTREASGGKNQWYRVVLTEGKNREIRRIFSHFRSTVNRLIRVRYGIFMLKDLPAGALVEVPGHIVEKFIKGLDKQPQASRTARGPARDPAPARKPLVKKPAAAAKVRVVGA